MQPAAAWQGYVVSHRVANYWQRRNRLFMERGGRRTELRTYNSLNIEELDLPFEF